MTNNFDYSVRVRNGASWRNYSRVRLMISVGKEYHEGKKLLAAVNWINRNPNIEEVHISVNDLLQRHNFMAEGKSEQEATNIALFNGTSWMERNEDVLNQIKPKKFFTRWEDWFSKPEFTKTFNQLLSYRDFDPAFEEAIATDANALAERKMKRGEFVPPSLVQHSQNYVEEELAVFAVQSAALPAAEVYPGTNLQGAEYMLRLRPEQKAQLPEAIKPLSSRHFTRIDFEHINVTPVPTRIPVAVLKVA
ncbi:MAG: hypothetical protein PHD48_11855 [Alphaproteobacteria bacterium]|nr:hypothetical protein [Alphaproteobacteria bacterium]